MHHLIQETQTTDHLSDETLGAIGVCAWDQAGRCVAWDQQAASLFGTTEDRVIGEAWATATRVVEDDRAAANKTLQQLLRGEKTSAEWMSHHHTTDHGARACRWRWLVVTDGGRERRLLSAVEDLQPHASLTRRFANQAQSLSTAQRLASIGIWEYDRVHETTVWSRQMYQLLNRDPGLGPPVFEDSFACYAPDSQRQLRQTIDQVMRTGETQNLDLGIALEPGLQETHFAVIEPVHDKNGHSTGVRGIVQDITARKLMEASLAESESRFRLLAEHSADLIGLLTPDGRYVYLSPAFETTLGWKRHEIVGQDAYQFIHPDDHDGNVREVHRKLLAGDNPAPMTYRKRHAKGHWVWVESRTGSVRSARGEVTHIVCISRDITERLRLQSEARARELAHLSRLATLGEMSTSIAHEVNQPLAAIAMLAKTFEPDLEAGAVDHAALLQVLHQIRDEALRAGEIIHRVKSMARKHETAYETHDLKQLLEEALATIEPIARQHGCQIHFNPPAEPCLVRVDSIEIKQVALNVLMNALEAGKEAAENAPHNTPTIHLDIEDGDAFWQCNIADNGPGIAEHKLDQIFNAFTTTKESGLGLGLSICVNLVEKHNGKIWVEPHLPQGACFKIALPKAIEASP